MSLSSIEHSQHVGYVLPFCCCVDGKHALCKVKGDERLGSLASKATGAYWFQ